MEVLGEEINKKINDKYKEFIIHFLNEGLFDDFAFFILFYGSYVKLWVMKQK